MKTGTVDLPLHPGRCPAWLFERMRPLSREISRLIIENHGTRELLKRLSDPMFFQALGCVLGFDWHSSGLTTTTCGALKEANLLDFGVAVTGGKGRRSRDTLDEIRVISEKFGLCRERLEKASILSAKVDSSCIQAGYDLYHHSFLFDERGNWAVIQQGMNDKNSYARRYHWFNSGVFVDSPPLDIAGKPEERALNMVSLQSTGAREVSVDIIKDNPERFRKYFDGQMRLTDDYAEFPARHEILPYDLTKKDWEILHSAYELQPQNYEELVSIRGMGKKKIRALALLAKLIHGSELDWKDPVKYSFAHGGKDGIPFPVDRGSYENSIGFLRDILIECNSGSKDRALKALAEII
jgi:hypothetical protein